MKKYGNPGNILIAGMTACLLGSICRLGIPGSILLGGIVFVFLPSCTKYVEKEKESYTRYTQACLYMEQIENTFKKKQTYLSLIKGDLCIICKRRDAFNASKSC